MEYSQDVIDLLKEKFNFLGDDPLNYIENM